MKTVTEIIKARRGSLATLEENYLRIENPGWMPLTIEIVRRFPGSVYEVSVCHYGEQNGDAMRDPEMTFLVRPVEPEWLWEPLYFRNDYVGLEHWCVSFDTGVPVVNNTRLRRELEIFAWMWDANLRAQGFACAKA